MKYSEQNKPIFEKAPYFLHGADYNPDQWRHMPEIWDQDFELMDQAHCNVMSIGIFSWTNLEPEEDQFDFGWLDVIMNKLADSGKFAMLATPSGARPAWMAAKYPEVLRVEANRVRNLYGNRHNHCLTSSIYRKKVKQINTLLANRYKNHKALLGWHISNEYGGACHCESCQNAFRDWLKVKYNNDLELLNQQWWTGFWSHTFTDFSQIESPAPHGDGSIHGLELDWRRFVTHMTMDFFLNEAEPLREITPEIPITTNFMETFDGLDYEPFSKIVDVVSWDSYPKWRGLSSDIDIAAYTSFNHDWFRSMKGGKPFMLMESTPSLVNWQPVSALKRPNQHLLASLQAVAHGADTVQYFQWRKGRGGSEKFHGAVVDHSNTANTRVFKDVAGVGSALEKLTPIVGTTVDSKVALIYDTDNRWALQSCQGLRNDVKDYLDVCVNHYQALWEQGINIDVISSLADFSKYQLVIAPMLYMVKPGVAERIETFVAGGGTFVTTYFSGIVNENDLCFMNGFPGPLRKVLGIWSEEIDTYQDGVTNQIVGTTSFLQGSYTTSLYSDLFHLETAKALAVFDQDFFKGNPALAQNQFGKGQSYYIGFKGGKDFLFDFYKEIIESLGIQQNIVASLPNGISLSTRTDGVSDFDFIMNFTNECQQLTLLQKVSTDVITNTLETGSVTLEPFGIKILERKK